MRNMTNEIAKHEIATQENKGFLIINTLDDAIKIADIIATSSFCPKGFVGKRGDVLVCMQMGAELGLKPLQALQNIAVINGRPSIWGDAMLALCQQAPQYEYIDETFDDATMTAYCKAKRKGSPEAIGEFSKEDAIKAGLWGKNVWAAYPKRMLKMRARGFALRDTFADALRGLISVEEAEDYPTLKSVDNKRQERILKPIIKEEITSPQQESQLTTPLADRLKRVIKSFAKIGVTIEDLEKRLGHTIDTTVENELIELYDVYQSIKNEKSKPVSSATNALKNLLQLKSAPNVISSQANIGLDVDPETGEILPPELQ
ncbi:MAG: RecT protein [Caudoviricetes sp.]|nr:MAG: RecT protein [Caudoviricetes sp.]